MLSLDQGGTVHHVHVDQGGTGEEQEPQSCNIRVCPNKFDGLNRTYFPIKPACIFIIMIVLQVDGVEIKKSSTCTTWSLSSSILKSIHQIPGNGGDGDGVGGDDGDGVGGDDGDGVNGDDGDDDGDLLVRRISHLDLILFRSRLISKGVWRFTLWKVNSRVHCN